MDYAGLIPRLFFVRDIPGGKTSVSSGTIDSFLDQVEYGGYIFVSGTLGRRSHDVAMSLLPVRQAYPPLGRVQWHAPPTPPHAVFPCRGQTRRMPQT